MRTYAGPRPESRHARRVCGLMPRSSAVAADVSTSALGGVGPGVDAGAGAGAQSPRRTASTARTIRASSVERSKVRLSVTIRATREEHRTGARPVHGVRLQAALRRGRTTAAGSRSWRRARAATPGARRPRAAPAPASAPGARDGAGTGGADRGGEARTKSTRAERSSSVTTGGGPRGSSSSSRFWLQDAADVAGRALDRAYMGWASGVGISSFTQLERSLGSRAGGADHPVCPPPPPSRPAKGHEVSEDMLRQSHTDAVTTGS